MRSLWFSLVLVACSHDVSNVTPAPAAATAPSQVKRLDPGKDLTSLASRMNYEAEHRPHAGVSSETVLDALAGDGLRLDARRQYLGLTMHASYCAGGTTHDGIAVSVCEYASDKDAAAAKAFADKQYAALGNASRATRGAALLTVIGPTERASRAIRTFSTL